MRAREYRCAYRNEEMGWELSCCPNNTCTEYKPRKEPDMSKNIDIKEAYKVMQAAWVDLYDVKVGDTVKVVRIPSHYELGSQCDEAKVKKQMVGSQYKISEINDYQIVIRLNTLVRYFPFFCLEKIKSAPKEIELRYFCEGRDITDDMSDKSKQAARGGQT